MLNVRHSVLQENYRSRDNSCYLEIVAQSIHSIIQINIFTGCIDLL